MHLCYMIFSNTPFTYSSFILCGLLILGLFSPACQSNKAQYDNALNNQVDSVSYVIGESLYRSFENTGLHLDGAKLRQGYVEGRDSLAYFDMRETMNIVRKLEMEIAMRQGEPFTSTEQPVVSLDSIAYAMGADLAYRFATLDLKLNPDALYFGVHNYAENGVKGSRLAGNLYDIQFQRYQKWVEDAVNYRRKLAIVENKVESDAFFKSLESEEDIQQTASGLRYKLLKAGSGTSPVMGDSVRVHYEGRLVNGTVFDKTTPDDPADFLLKEGYLIRGWIEALEIMKPGDKMQLYVPSILAYGSQGFKDIEPNKALIFDIELIKVWK